MRARICQRCGVAYDVREHQGVRFCSVACYRAAPRPAGPPRPVPSRAEVYREMQDALARAVGR